MRRRTAAGLSTAAVLCGLVMVFLVPRLAAHSDAAAPFRPAGAGAAARLAQPSRASHSAAPQRAASRQAGPARASRSSAATRPRVAPPAPRHGPPVHVTVRGTGISAPVAPIGVDRAGEVAIPANIHRLGWYRYSAAPGSRNGSVVVVGHVDSAVQGEGAFFTLHTVPVGARVVVTMRDHHRFVYRVVGREQFPKTSVPLRALFSRTGAPRLTLITCGGAFDAAARSYLANVVVTAVPV